MTVKRNALARGQQRSSRPRMLIVAHELTLTGSPMNLLHLLRWMVNERSDEVDVEVLALAGGALESRFRDLAPVTVLDPGPTTTALAAVQGGLQHLGSSRAWRPVAEARLRPQLRRLGRPDLGIATAFRRSAWCRTWLATARWSPMPTSCRWPTG